MRIIKKIELPFVLALFAALLMSNKPGTIVLRTENVTMELSSEGNVVSLADRHGRNYIIKDIASPMLQVVVEGKLYSPEKLKIEGADMLFYFNNQRTSITIARKTHASYLSFEITGVSSSEPVEKVIWGPYQVSLAEKIGKSIGVVYNNEFAIGLMGLNLKSCGGFEIVHRERFGNTAQKTEFGASLQGFTRDRSVLRLDDNCLQELTAAAPVNDSDASLIGSKFAIYGVPANKLKPVIAEIEQNECLSHPTHEGEWMKNSPYATSSKFIMSFTAANIDSCLDVAQKAGIACVYHPDIFESWGTYPVRKKDFPNGYQSVLECAQKAKARNIILGAHALSNFITKNDALVMPAPHPGLQLAGVTTLKEDLSADAAELILSDKSVAIAYDKDDLNLTPSELKANENKNRELFAIKVGDEIIEYSSVAKDGNLVLKDCKRGSFGTKKSAHKAGEKVGRLASHYYKVFFADINLQDQVAKNLADFFNATKLEEISFDGIEGALATGHGRYSCDRFIKVFFDNMENKNIIANSSDLMHYSWHYLSNESWGEPWWAKSFRESQLDHRLKVQKELEEDLMPRKMGQFSIRENTTLKDIQWVMGLCAGYNAGVDFYVSPGIIRKNPQGNEILSEIKKWEKVRFTQALDDEQKEKLRDPFSFYLLDDSGEKPGLVFVESWMPETGKIQSDADRNSLSENIMKKGDGTIISLDYTHVNVQKEPGQPTHAEWDFYCPGEKQKLQFAIRLPKESRDTVKGVYLQIGASKCEIPFTLKPGEYLVCQENQKLQHFSADGDLLESDDFSGLQVERGKNVVLFDYFGKGRTEGPEVIVNFKINK